MPNMFGPLEVNLKADNVISRRSFSLAQGHISYITFITEFLLQVYIG